MRDGLPTPGFNLPHGVTNRDIERNAGYWGVCFVCGNGCDQLDRDRAKEERVDLKQMDEMNRVICCNCLTNGRTEVCDICHLPYDDPSEIMTFIHKHYGSSTDIKYDTPEVRRVIVCETCFNDIHCRD